MRVAVDARLRSGTLGGIENVVVGLAHGLSQLEDSAGTYTFLSYADEDGWLRPHVSGPCRIVTVPSPHDRWGGVKAWLRRRTPALAASLRRWRSGLITRPRPVQTSDGSLEGLGVDIVHYPSQQAFLTDLPFIYHPHDLQHRHLPEFFSAGERARRDHLYRTLCGASSMVAVVSEWVRRDVVAAYDLPPEKVAVIPLAPPVEAYVAPTPAAVEDVRVRHGLPERYVLYPAATWPHKNHLRLLDALAELRDRGSTVPLVCTGMQTEHFPALVARARRLGLTEDVRWLGFVSASDLTALYAGATALVVPTEFEAASFPIWEAFSAGVPVACSNVTSLPEQVGDAALVFDPERVEDIAGAIERLWSDEDLRHELVERGRRRVSRFTWLGTARMFRAHYRRLAGVPLEPQDEEALASSPAF